MPAQMGWPPSHCTWISLVNSTAAGRRALLPVGTRRAPHGRGASARGGASAAGMATARTAGRGRLCGGVPGRAGLAKRAQTPPLAISLTSMRDATSAPSRARVRAPPGGALSPPPQASPGGGGAEPKRLRYVNRAGRAQAALPALPAPPRGNRRERGGTRGTGAGVTRAGRAPAQIHTRGGGGGTTASGRSAGAEAATSAAQVEQDLPSPPRAVPGQPRQLLPPSPHRKGHSVCAGNEQGSHGALCRPCVMSIGPRHASHATGTGGCGTAVAATTRGIPGCWWGGGGQRFLPFQGGGGCSNNWALCPSGAGACAGSLVRGRGRGFSRDGSSGAAARGHTGAAARPREGLKGGHITRGGRPSAAPRCAATHRGARGGIGQAIGRL